MPTYRGSCHCGDVRFEAELDLGADTYRCNCSICRRTRFWAAIARPQGFRVLAGQDRLTEYRFGSGRNWHYFCNRCGVRPFGIGNDTRVGPMIGVNIGCLEGLGEEQLGALTIQRIDGMNDRMQAPAVCAHL